MKGNRKAQRDRERKELGGCVCKHILKHIGKCELNINYFMLRNLGRYL